MVNKADVPHCVRFPAEPAEPAMPVSPRRLRWLEGELARWRKAELIDQAAAERIAASYVPSTRIEAIRLFLFLGAGLAGTGVIWLVAANVDVQAVGPLERFAVLTLVWLGLVAAAEACRECRGGRLATLGGPLRLLALLAYGATIFQTAQSLQVPAYEPSLLLAWSLGGLAYVYATRAAAALVLAVATLVGWWIWALLDGGGQGPAVVLALALTVPVTMGIAAAHDGGRLARLARPWRAAASLLALGTMFAAGVPGVAHGQVGPPLPIVLGGLVAVAVGVLAIARRREALPEVIGAMAVAAATALLVGVAPEHYVSVFSSSEAPGGTQIAYSVLAGAMFLAAAVGVALMGVRHEARGLTNVAFGFLLVFVAVQSFGALATILSGAGLLLASGLLLLVIGMALMGGRRRLLEEIAK